MFLQRLLIVLVYFKLSSLLLVAVAIEVTLYDSSQLDSLNWSALSAPTSPANRQWREASFSTGSSQVSRVYTVCNVAVLNTDNWLYVPYIARSVANRLHVQVQFSIRQCANHPDPISLQQCKESFRVLYYDADGPVDVTGWQESQFTSVDVIGATTLFTDTSNPKFNNETRSFTVTRSGAVFAFRDQGACMTLISMRIYYNACDSVVSALASYPQTAAGPDESSIVQVSGTCADHSDPHANNLPSNLCMADGHWFAISGGCNCHNGYELDGPAQCAACPMQTYKPIVANTKCLPCPDNSMTSSIGSSYCTCIDGYQRAVADNFALPCSRELGFVRNLSVSYVYGMSVILSWQPPISGGTELLYSVQCPACGSNVLFLPRQSALNTTGVTVRGLVPSVVYVMTVFTEDSAGVIGNGVDVIVQTPAISSVSSKPTQCHVTEAGSRRISLAWQAPAGSLDLYEINYWTNQFNYSISVVYSLLPNVTVYGLQPYTVYSFTIRGRTSNGGGWTDYSDILYASTQQDALVAENQLLSSASSEKNLVGIVVGSAFGIIFCMVVLVVMALFFTRRSQRIRSSSSGSSSDMLKYISGLQASHLIGTTTRQSSAGEKASVAMSALSDNLHVYADLPAYEDPVLLRRQSSREVDPNCVTIERLAGRGHFGDIFFGRLTSQGSNPLFVSVEILSDMASERDRMWFMAKADLLRQLDDVNVIYMEGVVTKSSPEIILTEYAPHGSLLDFLQNGQAKLASSELLSMVQGVASGMQYLADRGYIHTNLSAENVLVGERYTCKIASFDYCRRVGEKEISQRRVLSIRWSAPEVLNGLEFTHACDVWSYGVVVWEIISLGKFPYSGLSDEEVKQAVREGSVLALPSESCPEYVYRLMLVCWQLDPLLRPTFSDIVKLLHQFSRPRTLLFTDQLLNDDGAFV